jgi:lysophospholipase L1-like esterase
MRDREAALEAPRIVVTGDSFAMGWGVAQSEMLSAVLGQLTGEKTLAAAEPSYGTVRELMLLREVDLSAAHTLVIQYCENDFIENARFVRAGGRLETMTREKYEATVADHLATARYWPGKHFRHFVPLLWRSVRGDDFASGWVRHCDVEAGVFANVLRRIALRDRPLRVVVFEAMYTPALRSCFGTELEAIARDRAKLPPWASGVDVIDTTTFLTESDYYRLDDHLNANGHRKIARVIADLLANR